MSFYIYLCYLATRVICKILCYQYGGGENIRTGCLGVLQHARLIMCLWWGITPFGIRLARPDSFLNSSGTRHSTPLRDFVLQFTGFMVMPKGKLCKGGYFTGLLYTMGTAIAQWLRCCATNRKVAGVSWFFIDINPSDRTMALGSTQPLTEMSTSIISWR